VKDASLAWAVTAGAPVALGIKLGGKAKAELRPLTPLESAEKLFAMQQYGLSDERAHLMAIELTDAARRLDLRMDRLHPRDDIRSEMTKMLLDKDGLMAVWARSGGRHGTIQAYISTAVYRAMTETAGPVRVPMIRHSRDSDRVKALKRGACAVPQSLELAEQFHLEEEANELPLPLREYVAEHLRKRHEDMLDQLRQCLPMLFFRMEGGKAAAWPMQRRKEKVAARLAAGKPPVRYRNGSSMSWSTERRERSVRAGFRLWQKRCGVEVPEAVIDSCVDRVKRWR
jgi:hypothetical protein